nr:MAG TPA: hypothetical protein [Caudoviricetes sp.]
MMSESLRPVTWLMRASSSKLNVPPLSLRLRLLRGMPAFIPTSSCVSPACFMALLRTSPICRDVTFSICFKLNLQSFI